jgi:predicted lipase
MELVSEMHKQKYLDWLGDSWRDNKPFILCLFNTGGLPRALECYLEALDSRARLNKLILDQMSTKELEGAYDRFFVLHKYSQLLDVSKKIFFLLLVPK